jgi:hypothetical protein
LYWDACERSCIRALGVSVLPLSTILHGFWNSSDCLVLVAFRFISVYVLFFQMSDIVIKMYFRFQLCLNFLIKCCVLFLNCSYIIFFCYFISSSIKFPLSLYLSGSNWCFSWWCRVTVKCVTDCIQISNERKYVMYIWKYHSGIQDKFHQFIISYISLRIVCDDPLLGKMNGPPLHCSNQTFPLSHTSGTWHYLLFVNLFYWYI